MGIERRQDEPHHGQGEKGPDDDDEDVEGDAAQEPAHHER